MKKMLIYLPIVAVLIMAACSKDEEFTGKASFTYSPNVDITSGATITFTNSSSNASFYFWDFGDGNFSDEKETTHIYHSAGTYIVKLAVQNSAFIDYNDDKVITTDDRLPNSDAYSQTIVVAEYTE